MYVRIRSTFVRFVVRDIDRKGRGDKARAKKREKERITLFINIVPLPPQIGCSL